MMERLRLATFNVEWFNALFDDSGRLLEDLEPSARYHVTRADQIGSLGIVFTALDADGLMIIEAPDQGSRRSTVRALENFATKFGLRARKAVHGFSSETEQEIAFLYDPDRLTARHDPQGGPEVGNVPRFDASYRYDLNNDGVFDTIRFSKPPLELAVETAGGRKLRLIGVHAKSKAPHGVKKQDEFNRISIENRRKQLAECLWIRARVEQHLRAGDSLIVMGDFNDGPGLDEYEALFGYSGVEIVMGADAPDDLRLQERHAAMALRQRVGLSPTSARFWLAAMKRYFEALLDFIMLSPDLCTAAPDWRIWHPFNDPAALAAPELRDALLAASDHFPVTVDLAL
ncbi:MAG: endonuclease [Paracoccaceae bacterium]